MKVISPENVIYTLVSWGRGNEIESRTAKKYFYMKFFYGMKLNEN